MISFDSTARFRACVKSEGLDRQAAFAAMQLTAAAWGQPHLHSGRSIRRLGSGVFESRLDRDIRLVFLPESDRLVFDFAGNHDQVQAYLKNRR
ncbi:MAG: hypothetical protein KA257_11130 [Opitutaceae bacterium]|nr:hypothetical protein [Opitutaceae bacterium]MBP9913049.1 hypothetical protein [Opitutaceae bacterium]